MNFFVLKDIHTKEKNNIPRKKHKNSLAGERFLFLFLFRRFPLLLLKLFLLKDFLTVNILFLIFSHAGL